MSNTNPLNNQSYINKEFQTIYPELLDAVKNIEQEDDPVKKMDCKCEYSLICY